MSRPPDPAVEARARGKFVPHAHPENEHRRRRSRRQQARAPPNDDDDDSDHDGAFSIRDFCQRHSISESFFHKLKSLGLGPAIMKVGARTLISREAAAAWRREREAPAVTAAGPLNLPGSGHCVEWRTPTPARYRPVEVKGAYQLHAVAVAMSAE
jgi:hypothetical protein